jgi:hypothetical protein
MVKGRDRPKVTHVNLVLNFLDELRGLSAAK